MADDIKTMNEANRMSKMLSELERIPDRYRHFVNFIAQGLKGQASSCHTYLGKISLTEPLEFRNKEGVSRKYNAIAFRIRYPAEKHYGMLVFFPEEPSSQYDYFCSDASSFVDSDPNRSSRSTTDEWQKIFEVVVESTAIAIKAMMSEIDPDQDRMQKLQETKQRIISFLLS